MNLAEEIWGNNPISARRLQHLIFNLGTEAIFRHVLEEDDKKHKDKESAEPASTSEIMSFFSEREALEHG